MDKNEQMMRERSEKESLENNIQVLNDVIRESQNIVFFGGAGVSTESGIPDFRSPDGLYNSYINPFNASPETILSRSYFERHTKEFYRFYREKMLYLSAEPNRAHKKLAELEKAGKNVTVVTQNIDGLHQKAGSGNVLELHGSVYRNHCMKCGHSYSVQFVAKEERKVPLCSICGGIVKPDVVLYEESLDEDVIIKTIRTMEKADMLIVAGTSLAVYPAASFLGYFRGRFSVVINLAKHEKESRADLVFHERVGDILSRVDTAYCTE